VTAWSSGARRSRIGGGRPTSSSTARGACRTSQVSTSRWARSRLSPRGIVVDDHLRSPTNRRVYAIGDAAATPYQLATTGDLEGAIAARNILEGDRHVPDVFVLPTAVFTHPPLASVGLTEARAREAGHDVRVNRGRMRTWPSSRRIGQKHGAFLVILENDTDRILGAHLLGHGMDEAVNVLALAMRQGVTAEELRGGLWSYPTYVSDLKYMLG
jgi:glutathione reductase (NADPH)